MTVAAIVKYIDDLKASAMATNPSGDEARLRSLRRLLLARSAWFEDRVLQAAPRFGYDFVTPAMHRLFAHMSSKPVSMSELARRLAVTRQAVHQTVNQARRRGIVELVADPLDARLRNVRFTAKGMRMVRSAADAVRAIERDLERRLGRRNVDALRRILADDW
jgi:DNA-binding MarR family transcriptional regulator